MNPAHAVDYNLLVALDAMLDTSSVTAAAGRLRTSVPAMSRTLGRLRRHFGDPLLVRAGRNLVLTPFAIRLKPRVHDLVAGAAALLADGPDTDRSAWNRTLTLQISDVMAADVVPPLLAAMRAEAPNVRLRLTSDDSEGTTALRDGAIDLEIGVIDHDGPGIVVEPLTSITVALAVRAGHPLTRGRLTAERLAAAGHVSVSRRGSASGPLDDQLARLGLRRTVAVVVPTHTAAFLLARNSDLVCLTPRLEQSAAHVAGLRVLPVPFDLPPVGISMAWHTRTASEPIHRWLRTHVAEATRAFAARFDDVA
ncbi:DNA-binding transcriptional LysR family regulator [Actinoplanes campanulatus]|uniref:DNA-binding transcriptional LysR family regulator n=1 Tax=Actinoplanes campanulatus TaxID=113559 RepID=A0A7W5FJY2_9ACTN|nr:LysR family transcriptional regulator [Actinoplanes campanulatus]MBB3101214.1 DNA-binding transcriptional LysR family regulator [Actinoplanes campanulatus]GGN51974.1 hypothetical protein GCM10010109_92570 [Actinoplanes campanulatus]GID41961.1 hypothetical protein Aca09nite_84670 [Actinoplanes campanulatus]